jgi:hypothetical protein
LVKVRLRVRLKVMDRARGVLQGDGGVGAFLERAKLATANRREQKRVCKAKRKAIDSPGAKARKKELDRLHGFAACECVFDWRLLGWQVATRPKGKGV